MRHAACLLLLALMACVWGIPLPARLQSDDSRVVRYSDGRLMYVTLSPDEQWRLPAISGEVDPEYTAALLAFEDARFFYHLGVDPIAMLRASVQWVSRGHAVSGGSTITMQLVRMLEPRPRTVWSKAVECMRATQLELRMTKAEILQQYMRFAPFGRNMEGVRAASIAYFGHPADKLAPHEIAMLVTVPQDPNRRYPSPANQGRTANRVQRIIARLVDAGVFDSQQAQLASDANLPSSLRAFPREAPHFAQWVLRQQAPLDAAPQAVVDTTLQRGTQHMAERVMNSYRREWQDAGIHNGAVVVLDTSTRAVVAAVGNFSFDDVDNAGQVIGFAAPRAPGSLLKPFVYALAIEQGRLLPTYQLEDVPRRFGSYEPRNFDERYRGLVRADHALSQSLNVPFVELLSQMGTSSLLNLLERGGLSTLGPASRYGLSLAIGGAEVTLLDITTLYAALARDGRYAPYEFRHVREASHESPLLSPGASYLTRQALSLRDRPDFPSRRSRSHLGAQFFWKTGTSFQYRDAWAVGGNANHTIGVWVGNFDGHGVHALVGAERAAPLLFDLFDGVGHETQAQVTAAEPSVPTELSEVEVCAESGYVAGAACPHKLPTLARLATVPVTRCAMHQHVEVDVDSGHAVCALCRVGRRTETRVVKRLPAAVARLKGLAFMAAPSHSPTCPHVQEQPRARIRAPHHGSTVWLVPGLAPSQQQIPLEVDADENRQLYLFVNGKLVGPVIPKERQWLTPARGTLEVKVVDAEGQGDRVVIQVDDIG